MIPLSAQWTVPYLLYQYILGNPSEYRRLKKEMSCIANYYPANQHKNILCFFSVILSIEPHLVCNFFCFSFWILVIRYLANSEDPDEIPHSVSVLCVRIKTLVRDINILKFWNVDMWTLKLQIRMGNPVKEKQHICKLTVRDISTQ